MEGKVGLVTGASSGIGRASALLFAKTGANVIIADIDAHGGQETVRMIKEAGGEAAFIRSDVSKAADVEALFREAIDIYHRLDYAHNNAGIPGDWVRTEECTEENWDRVISINLKGVWLCMKHEITYMSNHGGGAIVNTSSGAGLAGLEMQAAYSSSKHGIIGLTKSAALESAKAAIRINAVCPGPIRTHKMSDPEVEARWSPRIPMGRVGSVEEVAGAVVWLCSDSASFVTGHTLVVDGGRRAL